MLDCWCSSPLRSCWLFRVLYFMTALTVTLSFEVTVQGQPDHKCIQKCARSLAGCGVLFIYRYLSFMILSDKLWVNYLAGDDTWSQSPCIFKVLRHQFLLIYGFWGSFHERIGEYEMENYFQKEHGHLADQSNERQMAFSLQSSPVQSSVVRFPMY